MIFYLCYIFRSYSGDINPFQQTFFNNNFLRVPLLCVVPSCTHVLYCLQLSISPQKLTKILISNQRLFAYQNLSQNHRTHVILQWCITQLEWVTIELAWLRSLSRVGMNFASEGSTEQERLIMLIQRCTGFVSVCENTLQVITLKLGTGINISPNDGRSKSTSSDVVISGGNNKLKM